MFDKLQQGKELLKMRNEAMALQKQLKEITENAEDRDNKVIVSADQKIIYLKVDGEDRSDIVNLINKAFKEVQKKAAKKMMESGGGLGGLLGNLGK